MVGLPIIRIQEQCEAVRVQPTVEMQKRDDVWYVIRHKGYGFTIVKVIFGGGDIDLDFIQVRFQAKI